MAKAIEKTCPRCGINIHGIRAVRKTFGTTIRSNGKEYANSYCRECKRKYGRESRKPVQDYGIPPKVPEYEPVVEFNPETDKPEAIFKISVEILDDMLKSAKKKKALAVGVPIKRVN